MSGVSLDMMSRGMKRIAAGLRAGELKSTEERLSQEGKSRSTVAMATDEIIEQAKLAEIIRRNCQVIPFEKRRRFTLNTPCKLATLMGGVSSLQAFIGEEEFVLGGVFSGNTFLFLRVDDLQSNTEESAEQILIKESVAVDYLDGFKAYLYNLWEMVDDDTAAETRLEAQKIEDAAHEEAKIDPYKANPLFGSW